MRLIPNDTVLQNSLLRSVETGLLGLDQPAAAGSSGETLQQLVVSVRSVPMGGRRSPQALAPIVERIPAKVLVHAEPADAAAIAGRRRGRPAAEDRIVTAAAAAAFDSTAAHQRRNRWHRFARSQGGKVAPTDPVPPLEQIARVIVAIVVVEGVPKSIHNAIAKERWRRRRWIRIPGVHRPIAEPTFGKEQSRTLLGPVAGATAPIALLRIAHAGLRPNATR